MLATTSRITVAALALMSALAVSGCWGETKDDQPSKFVKELTECNNCTISKPFLGGGEKDEKGTQHGR